MLEIKMNTPLQSIIELCKKGDSQEKDIYEKLVQLNEKILRKVFLTEKVKENLSIKEQEYLSNYHFNPEYMNQMTLYSEFNPKGYDIDKDKFISYIGPCYNSFLYNVLFELNIFPKQVVKDDEDLSNEISDKIKELEKITEEKQLQNKFPLIYKKYQKDAFIKLNIEEFINCQIRLYKSYVENRHIYKEEIKRKNNLEYKNTVLKYLEGKKIELYIANYYLIRCKEKWEKYSENNNPRIVGETRRVSRKYLKFANNYLTYFRKVIPELDNYTNIRINDIELFDIEKKWYELNDSLQPKKDQIPKPLVIDSSQLQRRQELSTKELEKLKSKGEAKNEFYRNHPWDLIIIGTPHTYTAFVSSNGIVVLDREYSRGNPKTGSGDAIFFMSIDTFLESLEKLNDPKENSIFDKQILNQNIKDNKENSKIKRIIHGRYWQEELEKIIEEPIAIEDLEDKLDELANKVKVYKR